MSTAWIGTAIRWTAVVLIVWMGYQALPGMVDQVIDWRREEACIARDMDWTVDWSGEAKCLEKEEANV